MKKYILIGLLVCVGCATLIASSPKITSITTLAILPFENPVILYKNLGWQSFDRIQTELTKHNYPFKYLDKFALGPILNETWLGGDHIISKQEAIGFGKKLFADAVIAGKIIECVVEDPIEKDDYYDRERLKWHYTVTKKAHFKYTLSMYDTNKGRLLWAYAGKATAEAKSEFFAGSNYNIESNETMIERLLKTMAEDIANKLAVAKKK
jgi:hypothetical protein